MQIDASTVLLSGVLVKAVIAALFLVLWIHDRRSTWFAWWSAAFAVGALSGVLFLVRVFAGDRFSIGLGAATLIATMGLCWAGARDFGRRRPVWLPVLAATAAWLALCMVPGFLDSVRYRVIVSSLLIGSLTAMSAVEFWRDRDEKLVSRWPVIGVLGSLALLFFMRIPLLDLLPFPFGALPEHPVTVGAFNMLTFFHALILTVLLVAISKERLELQERIKAQTDPLTGTFNRRAFLERGERLLQRHKFEHAPLCFVLLDVDHFKSINDRLGHSGGDDALIRFVSVVQDSIRPTDFLFRIGGEEFCCLLPHTSCDQARLVAERIRRQFAATTVSVVAGMPVSTTASLGVASTEFCGYEFDTLMRRADEAVYAAKRQGRNRVVIAEAAVAETPALVRTGRVAVAT